MRLRSPSRPVNLPQEPFPGADPIQREAHILNPVEMQMLRNESPELLWRLIPLFNALAEKALAAMQAGLASGDNKAISAAAHTVKGSASNFGAERLVAVCQALEYAADEERVGECKTLIETARKEYDFVAQALKSS